MNIRSDKNRPSVKYHAVVLVLVALVVGCATRDPLVWYQPGRSMEQLRKDWAASQLAGSRARMRVPAPMSFGTENSFASGVAWRAQREATEAAEEIAPLTMQSKGYQLIRRSLVPPDENWLPRK